MGDVERRNDGGDVVDDDDVQYYELVGAADVDSLTGKTE